MSSSSPAPVAAPGPTSPPSPPSPTAPPPSNTTTPSTPSAPPPSNTTTPSAPPPSNTTTPPPAPAAATPSSPPPSPPTSTPPPTATPSTPPANSPPAPPSPSTTPPSLRPPPSTKSPSTPSTPSTNTNPPPPSSSSSSPSTSLVLGVAIGGVTLLLLFSLLCVCFWRKKRRRPTHQFGGPPPPHHHHKDDQYAGPPNWQYNAAAPAPNDHIVKMPPNPAPPPAFPNRPPQSPPPPPPPPPISSSGGSGSNYSGSDNPYPPPSPGMGLGNSRSTFTYEELAMATDGFSEANLLGQGGFGYVHRGLLPNGKEVAVKQLKAGSGQGEREFQAEVEIISRVHHKHLVTLVGYCISGGRMMLVYEFVPNNTLEFHLHAKGRPTMQWPTRLKIALGSAKGLAYLHEDCHPKIIHRDIKAANILLDFKFEAKVADFGLAKFASDNNTHVSTRVMGTFGYMAPEYASTGKLTDRSDVFSFGVMLLELITGRRPVDSNQSFMDDSLVDWARPLLARALDENNFDTLVDEKLERNYSLTEMSRMIACAAACVRHSAKRRPRMSQIVRALEGDVSLEDLNEGVRPGHSRPFGSYASSDYDSSQYNEDMKKFRKMALASRDYASSEYSAPTSEYGQVLSASSNEALDTQEIKLGKVKEGVEGFIDEPEDTQEIKLRKVKQGIQGFINS